MKYSFIIPVLNEEKLIPNLLNQICSVELKQKYDYEIILSDGGSRDNTVALALPLADKIICHTENTPQNISIGRNKGAECASGEFLIFINGDILFKDLNRFLEIIEKDFYNSSFAAFTCKVNVFPNEETFPDRLFIGFYNFYFRFLNLIGIGMGRGECHAISKSLFNELKGNNSRLAAGEDFEFFTRIRRRGKVLYSVKTCVYESPRRYRKVGHIGIFCSWLANSISVLIAGKSVTDRWSEIR